MFKILTGKMLPRRTLLRGLGASLALPFLDSMFPAFGLRGQAAPERVHRFQAFYVPNGMAMEYWSPKVEGRDFGLTPILEPLAPFRDQMLVLSGIRANWVQIHAGASGSFLTGIPQGGRTETEIIADVSMDQLLARKFGQETQVASLELSMDASVEEPFAGLKWRPLRNPSTRVRATISSRPSRATASGCSTSPSRVIARLSPACRSWLVAEHPSKDARRCCER